MKFWNKIAFACVGVLIGTLWGYATFAQAPAPEDLSFFQDVANLIAQWGGLPWLGKAALAITALVSGIKTSFLRPLWDKLGDVKIWIGPILGLLAGVLSMGASLTLEAAFAYITAGAGALFMHEILDLVKKIPGIGPVWLSVIEMLKILFRAPQGVASFLAVIALMSLTGCPKGTDPLCETAKIIAKPVAAGLGSLAACKNPAALEPWLIEKIKLIKPDLCKSQGAQIKSIVGDIICPSLIDGVIGGGIGLLPPAAECTGGTLADGAKESLLKFCKDSI